MSQQRRRYFLLIVILCLTFSRLNALCTNFPVAKINIVGNKQTNTDVILRELTFHLNDTIKSENLDFLIKTNEQNLLNTSLFLFVTITPTIDSNHISFLVSVNERWYIWPNPIIEMSDRNFNSWIENNNWKHINYGMDLTLENVRGRRETMKIIVRKGYREELGFSYFIPYVDKPKTLGINISNFYFQNKEMPVSTVNNKLIFIKETDIHIFREYISSIMFNYRPNIYSTSSLRVNFTNIYIADTIRVNYPNYLENKNSLSFFTLAFRFKQDFRDNKAYPLKGHLLEVEVLKDGIGILKNEENQFYTSIDFKKFAEINGRLFYGFSLGTKASIIAPKSYYFQHALGYSNDFVRGYEYYVIDGQHFILGKTNLKYNLVPTRIKNINWLPLEKFNTIHYAVYSNFFFDCGYVKDIYYKRNNPLNNTFIYGLGVGLDFVTYYDKVLRFEYSINKQKESGLFIHFIAPI